jgi:hypothetical protein
VYRLVYLFITRSTLMPQCCNCSIMLVHMVSAPSVHISYVSVDSLSCISYVPTLAYQSIAASGFVSSSNDKASTSF